MTPEERAAEVIQIVQCDPDSAEARAAAEERFAAPIRAAVADVIRRAVAEEAERWATGLCSAHPVPDAACRTCNAWLALPDFIAHEREACAAELQAMLDGDFCGSDVEALKTGIDRVRARSRP